MGDNTNKITIKISDNLHLRKKQLVDKLGERKLSVKGSDCDKYIKFGTSSIDDVVTSIEKREIEETKRLKNLFIELRKKNLLYDNRVSWYTNYIKRGGDLNKIIKNGEIEWFYLNKTDYIELLKIYKNEDVAQSKALTRYVAKHGNDKYTDKIVETDMTIRLN